MDTKSINKFIKEPALMTKKEFNALKEILNKYPFFQTAHLLFIKAAGNLKEPDIEHFLIKSATFISDRTKLYNLLTENTMIDVEEEDFEDVVAVNQNEIETETELKDIEIETITKVSEKISDLQENTTKDTDIKTDLAENKISEIKIEEKEEIKIEKSISTLEQKQEKLEVIELDKNKSAQIETNKESDTKKQNSVLQHESIINDFFKPRVYAQKIDDNSKNVKKEQLTAEESETENIKSPKEIIITSPQDKKKLTDDIFAKIEALKSEKANINQINPGKTLEERQKERAEKLNRVNEIKKENSSNENETIELTKTVKVSKDEEIQRKIEEMRLKTIERNKQSEEEKLKNIEKKQEILENNSAKNSNSDDSKQIIKEDVSEAKISESKTIEEPKLVADTVIKSELLDKNVTDLRIEQSNISIIDTKIEEPKIIENISENLVIKNEEQKEAEIVVETKIDVIEQSNISIIDTKIEEPKIIENISEDSLIKKEEIVVETKTDIIEQSKEKTIEPKKEEILEIKTNTSEINEKKNEIKETSIIQNIAEESKVTEKIIDKTAADDVYNKIAAFKARKKEKDSINVETIKPEEIISVEKELPIEINISEAKKEDLILENEKSISENIEDLNTKTEEIKESSEKENDLIKKFIKAEPKLDRSKEIDLKGDISEESVVEKGEIITELMANIYINQGYFDKAILIFEKLILKFPKKMSYFAEKIEDVKKMM